MKSPPAPPGAPESTFDDKATGLPALKTWPAVYLFVFAAFVVSVLLLVALDKLFS